MDYIELNSSRRSHRSYVPGETADRAELERLLEQASLAPSAYNMQGWHVVVVTDAQAKRKMFDEACPQKQVLDSSAMLIVCGDLEQYGNLPEIVQNTNGMDQKTRDHIVQDAAKSLGSNPAFARDEALRSASLFAMNFLLAATNAGYGTGPMIGFDAKKMSELFGIKPPFFPAMLISFGTVKNAPFPRGYRRPARAFARFV